MGCHAGTRKGCARSMTPAHSQSMWCPHCAEGAGEHPGVPRPTFVVHPVADVLDRRLRAHGADLAGEVAQYGST
jgi:hypothetical protein